MDARVYSERLAGPTHLTMPGLPQAATYSAAFSCKGDGNLQGERGHALRAKARRGSTDLNPDDFQSEELHSSDRVITLT